MQHANDLGQPSRQSNGCTRISQGNGRKDGENKVEFKGYAR